MKPGSGKLREPRGVGMLCALAATGLGLAYLAAAAAPTRYLVVNAVALLLGLVALRGFAGPVLRSGRSAGPVLVLLGSCLLATALFGEPVDGAARWVWIGPLGVQLSLVVLPTMILAFASRPDPVGMAGIAAAAAALALQPDRAMAGVLALALAVLAAARPGRWAVAALLVAGAAFAATLARPDSLPAVPYVDRILFTAFDVHILAGTAVLLGSLLLPVPAIVGWRGDPDRRAAGLVFGAIWLGCVAAAALGNYPTPVVGYGGSAILGYLLSLACLPAEVRGSRGLGVAAAKDGSGRLPELSERGLPASPRTRLSR
ncbi:MAG TPA: hypothetical protein VEA60_04205 [Allosphingosinicella sp.]|nr:hypothetical protein [Allosphingosinicella sp.]